MDNVPLDGGKVIERVIEAEVLAVEIVEGVFLELLYNGDGQEMECASKRRSSCVCDNKREEIEI